MCRFLDWVALRWVFWGECENRHSRGAYRVAYYNLDLDCAAVLMLQMWDLAIVCNGSSDFRAFMSTSNVG